MSDIDVYRANSDLFWSKTKPHETGCLMWTGPMLTSGYGLFSFPRGSFGEKSNGKNRGQRNVRAHRVSYALSRGEILRADVYVCHSCDTPACVNPFHLWAGSAKDNYEDMILKGRKTGIQKLDLRDVQEIFLSTAPDTELAQRFGVQELMIRRIRTGKAWRAVTQAMS